MKIIQFIVYSLILILLTHSTRASERVALVVGNSNYQHASSLTNPTNDAHDISVALKRLGFDVTRLNDMGFDAMRRALRDFSDQASHAEMAIIFYAGHGMEINKQNYLIPTDAELKTDRDVSFEAVPLDLVTEAVSGAKILKLVMLDACRNNPFAASMKMTNSSRSVGRGLARLEPTAGTLVTFAAKEGTEASDGKGRNSPYTKALLKHMETPGLEIQFLFREVRDLVMDQTDGQQQPFTYGSLGSNRIYLNGENGEVTRTDPKDNIETKPHKNAIDLAFWNEVKGTNDKELLLEYLKQYPDGLFSAIAKLKLARLTKTKTVIEKDRSFKTGATVIQFPKGSFELNKHGEWLEVGEDPYKVLFVFKETHRDETSIYGVDGTRNMNIQFDLERRKIGLEWPGHPMQDQYNITSVSEQTNARQISFVAMDGATFKQEGKNWVEFDNSGNRTHVFRESIRDMWSVYARDEGRKMDLQFDLYRSVIRLAWPGKEMFDWTAIKKAR